MEAPKTFEIPDELLDQYWDEEPADTIEEADESPGPAVEDDEPEASEEDAEETEESEAGDDEPVEEDELEEDEEPAPDESDEDLEDLDEDEPEDTPEAEEEDEESFLPKFDRKEIEKDPQLKAAYDHMRSKWTQAQQELRSAQREYETAVEDYQAFAEQLRDDAGAEEFLLAIAVHRPEVFEKAFDRASELGNDDRQKKTWEREQALKQREKQLERKERQEQMAAVQQQIVEIENKTQSYAEEMGLTLPAEVTLAEEAVAYVITTKRRTNPSAEITDSDIKNAVSRVANAVVARKNVAQKQATREFVAAQKKAVKKKAKAAKRPPPPKATSSPGVKSRQPPAAPKGTDPLDFLVDHHLGLHNE